MKYFSTFFTGFSEVVEKALKTTIGDIKIEILSDGLVIYTTNASIDEIKGINFFNNSFILFKIVENINPDLMNPFIKQIIRDPELVLNNLPLRKATFRVINSKQNEMVKIHSDILRKVEEKLSEVSRWQVDRSNPDFEFWFLLRKNGLGLFGLRITTRPNYEKTLVKGELYSELANILCLISEPSEDDIFLDPFAGSGAIPLERAKAFPYKQIFAGDSNRELVNKLKEKNKQVSKKIIINNLDATNLISMQNNSIDKIVTDPPWGIWQGLHLDLDKFYLSILKEFNRVLKKNGLLVILVAKREIIESAINKFDGFKILNIYTTLVGGQKVAVYKIKKI